MAEKVPMLALSPTMEKGVIKEWLKQENDEVSSGDVLCEVETDKAVMEYECPEDGVLLKIVVKEGGKAEVGETIAVIGESGEDVSGLVSEDNEKKTETDTQESKQPAEKDRKRTEAPDDREDEEEETPLSLSSEKKETMRTPEGRVRSTPLARTLAREYNVDLRVVKGSGPAGRIIKQDVLDVVEKRRTETSGQSAAQASVVSGNDVTVPVEGKRKVIAERLSESMFSAPHFYLKSTVLADELVGARKKINTNRESKLSFNAFLMKFVAESLRRFPQVNASWNDDEIIQKGSIDIALAVAVDDGLVTPVVRNCAAKGIARIDEELRELIEKARQGELQSEDYTNSTFTITNLGSYGVDEFTAIINPPASAILAVGKLGKNPVVDENDQIVVASTMALTLGCDHRVIDGALGAEFLAALKQSLEDPVSALL